MSEPKVKDCLSREAQFPRDLLTLIRRERLALGVHAGQRTVKALAGLLGKLRPWLRVRDRDVAGLHCCPGNVRHAHPAGISA
jgi:hypothetical protein